MLNYSLRYWASHDNLFPFALAPLRSHENYQLAWVTEHELIAQWQTLFEPWLSSRKQPWASAFPPGTFGLRLWRKLHKRMHRRNQRFFIKNSRELAWGLLFKLGSRARAAFDTSKLLRSRQTADEEVYALIKLSSSSNIENPHRNRVQGLLKSVVKFRTKMHWPETSRPLGVLPLRHPQFTSQCERWLRNIIIQYKYLFLPFMFPRTASERFHIQASRSFFTTSSLGKKPRGPSLQAGFSPMSVC